MSRAPDLLFPPFRLDRGEGRLYGDGQSVRLRPKSYALLTYLSERAGELVTKERLLESLWPGTYVSESVLKVCIRELRQALGDAHARPRFIETAHRRGYRFVARVTPIDRTRFLPGAVTAMPPLHLEVAPGGLVGRQAELAWLSAVAERAAGGRRQLAFILGEPGIGKSALANVFSGHLTQAARAVVARGQCVEHHGPAEAICRGSRHSPDWPPVPRTNACARHCGASHRRGSHRCLRSPTRPPPSAFAVSSRPPRVRGCCGRWPMHSRRSLKTPCSSSSWTICIGAIRRALICSAMSRGVGTRRA